MPTSRPLPVLIPDRTRCVPRSFAWLDHRLRSGGWLARLTSAELSLYVFLVLAADAQGLSCWRLDRVQMELCAFDQGKLYEARDGLVAKGLVAYRPWSQHAVDGSYQVLALPSRAPTTASPSGRSQGAGSIADALDDVTRALRDAGGQA